TVTSRNDRSSCAATSARAAPAAAEGAEPTSRSGAITPSPTIRGSSAACSYDAHTSNAPGATATARRSSVRTSPDSSCGSGSASARTQAPAAASMDVWPVTLVLTLSGGPAWRTSSALPVATAPVGSTRRTSSKRARLDNVWVRVPPSGPAPRMATNGISATGVRGTGYVSERRSGGKEEGRKGGRGPEDRRRKGREDCGRRVPRRGPDARLVRPLAEGGRGTWMTGGVLH